jgi:hypothetical protein
MNENHDALNAALFARWFGLLADRVELLRPDPAERVEVLLRDGGLDGAHPFDARFIADAGELDLMCGYAVRVMRAGGQLGPLLDVLGMLSAARVVGMYYALPDDRRVHVRRADPVWLMRLTSLEDDMAEALATVRALADAIDPDGEAARIAQHMAPGDLHKLEAQRRGIYGVPDPEAR